KLLCNYPHTIYKKLRLVDKQRLGIVSPEIMKKELKNVMLKLFDFQEKAVLEMVEKYEKYLNQSIIIKRGDEEIPVLFIQILDALTGSGKTVILAKTVGEISKLPPLKLIILWLSKASVVVEQSFNNLTSGGKYHHLLGKSEVIMLSEYQERLLEENETLILFATVGTFNQKDKEAGNRQIYQCKLDEQTVEAGLVKKIIKLAAYETPMEETVSSLVEDLRQIEEQIKTTNLPIEKCGIKTENIAVYCDLKFAKNYPKPPEFKLFSGGGEKKYQEFIA
ncbi:16958_t:CDS:2, partial [Cetraspora pellucida]